MEPGTGIDRRSWRGRAPEFDRANLAVMILAVIATATMLQATRVLFSYMVFIIDQSERVLLGVTAAGVFLALGLGAIAPRRLGPRGPMIALTIGMVAARLALQFWAMPEARLWLGAATIVLAGWLLPRLMTISRPATAYGVGLGLSLDLALRIGRDTVDLPFMPTVGAHAATLALGLLAVGAALALRNDHQAPSPGLAIGAFGPALAVHHLMIGNLGLPLVRPEAGWGATAWLLAASMLVGLALDPLVTRAGRIRSATPLLALLGGLGLLVAWQDTAGLGAAGLVIGAAASIALLITALRGGTGAGGVAATAIWLTTGMLVQAVVLFAYFSATGLPLLIALGYGVLAAAGLVAAWRPSPSRAAPRVSIAGLGAVAAVLLVSALVGTAGDEAPEAGDPLDGELTAMTYNIQSGFSRDNEWDLEAIAEVIEAADPDVVFLQEVGRGWPILTGVDQARWLSHRFDMQLVWGPASGDDLWGNAILTRAPIESTAWVKFDVTENLRRGAVAAVLASETGPVTVIGTHLDNPGDAESARQAQIAQVLAFWDGAEPVLIAGDFNTEPDSEAMAALAASGLVDTGAGLGVDATTSEDDRRIDYLLISLGIEVVDTAIPDTWASDHRPFVARLRIAE